MHKSIPYRKGRKSIKSKKKLNKKVGIIIIILIFCVGYKLTVNSFIQNAEKNVNTEENIINESIQLENNPETEDKKVEINLPEKIGNYMVIGELVIDKIGVKKEILNITEDASLNLSVTKFYGPNINEIRKFLYYRT